MRATARVTSKGQITIPKEIRDALHVRPGDTIEFVVRENGVVEVTRKQRGDLEALFRMLRNHVAGARIQGEAEEGLGGEREHRYTPRRRK